MKLTLPRLGYRGRYPRLSINVKRESFENRLVREAFETFDEMPGKRGCSPDLLSEIERELGCSLPPLYRRLMESDADRIANIPRTIHPSRLTEHREMADQILADEQDGYTFRLKPSHLVIAWEDIYGFYFVDANGSDSSPVLLFNYYDDSDNGLPRVESETFVQFIAWQIREYLKLPIS